MSHSFHITHLFHSAVGVFSDRVSPGHPPGMRKGTEHERDRTEQGQSWTKTKLESTEQGPSLGEPRPLE